MKIKITVTRETSWMLGFRTKCKKQKINVAGGVLDRVASRNVMPAQRSADKETLSFYVHRHLGKRLRKFAAMLNTTLTDVVVMILTKETANIELTPEDYEQIASETRAVKRKNSARPKAPPSKVGGN